MSSTSAIDVVSDANVALKWFRTEGEEGLACAHALLAAHAKRHVALRLLDLTIYEVGNTLLRGSAGASAEQAATVLDALAEICPAVTPDAEDLRLAGQLAQEHELSFYDASYAAVAHRRGAQLATYDQRILRAGLGREPAEIVAELSL